MNLPTPEQLKAMRRIQDGTVKIFDAQQRLNAIINENNLQEFGVIPLPAFPLSVTCGSLAVGLRLNESHQARRAA